MSERIDFSARENNNREYRNDEIVVTWEPDLCTHAAECLHGAPDVFRVMARPWVRINAAPAEEIARVVALCPSGALKYRLLKQD